MKYIFIILTFLITISCSKPKTVFICGDHICVNKAEAEQYFEENLTLEVRVLKDKASKEPSLIELNLNQTNIENKQDPHPPFLYKGVPLLQVVLPNLHIRVY